MLVFYALALTFGADAWRDHMVAAAIFGLLAIPARVVLATVEVCLLVLEERRDKHPIAVAR